MAAAAYLLDTDTLSLYLRGHEAVRRYVEGGGPEAISISAVTAYELLKGRLDVIHQECGRKGRGRVAEAFANLVDTLESLRDFPILPYDAAADAIFRSFSADVRRIGQMDCRIAAVAMAGNQTLVTVNRRHFEQVPGIALDDWTVQ